jgi:hypothetical protein
MGIEPAAMAVLIPGEQEPAEVGATTGCPTGSSNPMKTSSITAASPGTSSPNSPGKSCPSDRAIGPMHDQFPDLV